MYLVTSEQMKEMDRLTIESFGIPGMLLMENAGRGVVDQIEQLGVDGPIVIACGKGNNAGDGFVMARHLDLRGHIVRVLLCSEPRSLAGDARANYEILSRSGITVQALSTTMCLPPDASAAVVAGRISDVSHHDV